MLSFGNCKKTNIVKEKLTLIDGPIQSSFGSIESLRCMALVTEGAG